MTDENRQTPDVVNGGNPNVEAIEPPPVVPHPLAPLHERISVIADKIPEGDVHLRGIATVLRDLLGQVIDGR